LSVANQKKGIVTGVFGYGTADAATGKKLTKKRMNF